MRRRGLPPVLPLVLTLALTACGGYDEGAEDRQTVRVLAAASLTSSFEHLAEEFERSRPGVDVELSLAGSSDLAAQIVEGAPADVFASADEANMDRVVEEELVAAAPQPFASNSLVLAVPPDNPAGIESLSDLTRADVNLVACAPAVPCGAATGRAADAAGLDLRPVSEEQSVTDVVGKVASGEADAGIVYVTDVLSSGGAVTAIGSPELDAAVNVYPIAPIEGSSPLAAEFVDLVLGDRGQQILGQAGFAPPPGAFPGAEP